MNNKGFGQELSQFEFFALKKQEHQGFKAAYRLYADHVYSLALHIVKNEQTALDIMQAVFEKMLMKSSAIKDANGVGAWLKQCTINASIDYFRKNNREFSFSEQDSEIASDICQESLSPPDVNGEETVSIFLSKLPLLQRSIVYFYSVNGLKHKEIASNLGVNEAYSRKAYSRALKQLKSWLLKSGYKND